MESKWGPRAFLRAYQDEVRFGKLILPFWGPSGGQVGLMLATFSEVFEFPRRSLKEVRFQDDFEAILKRFGSVVGKQKQAFRCRGVAKINFWKMLILEGLWERFGRPKWSQNGVKMESKSVFKSFIEKE